MSADERTVQFHCEGHRLIGVLSVPAQPGDTGMLIVVGGPQYRAGSHRQFVQQARGMAAAGVPTLRFDVRGMGDSEGEPRNFEHISADIGAAIDTLLREAPTVRRVVLWGLCDGASAALLYLDDSGHDPRVQGLCLLNPWVRSEATLAATHVKHYYAQRLMQREFWHKLLRGQVGGSAVRGLARSTALVLRPQARTEASSAIVPFSLRMARSWARFDGRILLVLSENDYTAKEFVEAWQGPDWVAARLRPTTERLDVQSDHTFSQQVAQHQVHSHCLRWIEGLAIPAVENGIPMTEKFHANVCG